MSETAELITFDPDSFWEQIKDSLRNGWRRIKQVFSATIAGLRDTILFLTGFKMVIVELGPDKQGDPIKVHFSLHPGWMAVSMCVHYLVGVAVDLALFGAIPYLALASWASAVLAVFVVPTWCEDDR